jgi:hypothetical protein
MLDPGGNLAWLAIPAVCGGGACEAALAGLAIALGFEIADNGVVDGSVLGDPIRDVASSIAEEAPQAASSQVNPELNEGMQGKHIPGHNNHDPGRSPIAEGIDPGRLIEGAANGEYVQVGKGARGDPIFDFGKTIGTDAKSGKETRYGTVHSGNKGSHIVPANPDLVEGKARDEETEERNEKEERGGKEDP